MILFKGKQNDLDQLFPPTLVFNDQICVRNGVSARSKFMMGVYDIALYLGQMTEDAHTAITSVSNKHVRMVSRRAIKGDALFKAMKDGLQANCSREEYQKFSQVLDGLYTNFYQNNTMKDGEVFMIDIIPNVGVRLSYQNQEVLPYTQIEGFDQALLKIWLGDHPVSLEMKKDLLGQL